MSIDITPPSSVLISIEVRKYSDDSLVDPTTLDVIITDYEETTLGTLDIDDLTHDGTGLYSVYFLFPASAAEGLATIRVSADAAEDVSAITKNAYIVIK